MRKNKRKPGGIRPVKIVPWPVKYPEGSALIEVGDTRVLCAASVIEEVPKFLAGKGTGWVTAEYSMLPSSTGTRNQRERGNKISGRTQEIQRLIGRSLRAVVSLPLLGERTIMIDCDVLQADGGTRTASITGAFVAMKLAVGSLIKKHLIEKNPVTGQVAAISAGVIENKIYLDLDYNEDSTAEVDMNLVMTKDGRIVEIQATGERKSFTPKELDKLTDAAAGGINKLFQIQSKVIKSAKR